MNTQSLTQAEVRELFDYDGKNLLWKITRSNRVKVGGIAGTKHSCGYQSIRVGSRQTVRHYYAHRLIWLMVYGEWPDGDIDHLNGVRNDNRIENLRLVSPSLNNRNRIMQSNNTSGVNGVWWSKYAGKWAAEIQINRKKIHLGYFDCKYHAASVRHFAQEIEGGFTARHGK